MKDKNNEFGKKGEALAAAYLVSKGYKIVAKNYRFGKAEIDILARNGKLLIVVEVKSRSSKFIKNIAETVTAKKIKLLRTATNHFVLDKNLDVEVRFDIITILKTTHSYDIEHLEDAFYHF